MASETQFHKRIVSDILVPVEFSVNSDNALIYAINIARQCNAKLWILHCYRLIQTVPEMEGVAGFSLKEVLEKAWKDEFEKLKKNYFHEDFTNYSFLLEIGFPEDVIKLQTKKIPIDLVIMGTAGATGIGEILGSTTSKVVDMVDCPVLAIPASARFNGIKKVTIAYDEEKVNDPNSYSMILNLVRKFKSKLDIVNFNTTLKTGGKESEGRLSLDPYLDGVKHKYHFKAAGKIEKAITDFVEAEGTDILVMVAHDHGFIESLFHSSITRKMVLHAKTPLLIIHE
jgi:nucleotide-binding universal stress UspA family protein